MAEYKKDFGLKKSVALVTSRIIGSKKFHQPAPNMVFVGCTSLFGLRFTATGTIYYHFKKIKV